MQGNVVSWASSGGEGFRGSRKSTPFAAQMAAKVAAQRAIDSAGMRSVEVALSRVRESGGRPLSVLCSKPA
jgi:small subunit ribosomal protein S11